MRCYNRNEEGIEPALLFFFLILVLIFCKPGIVGCGQECCENESVCEPVCDC